MGAKLTAEEARRLFRYDPETGELYWRVGGGRRKVGVPAGCVFKPGANYYRRVSVGHKFYYAHRMAWLVWYGHWPKNEIDHINGDTLDNRIENLRDVDCAENRKNQRISSANTSGALGVRWHGEKGRWQARMQVCRKEIHLGYFDHLEDAVAARKEADKRYGFHENHGRVQM